MEGHTSAWVGSIVAALLHWHCLSDDVKSMYSVAFAHPKGRNVRSSKRHILEAMYGSCRAGRGRLDSAMTAQK